MGRSTEGGSQSREWRFLSESAVPGTGVSQAAGAGESSVGQALAAARPSDPLGLDLSRGVVAAQLFGLRDTPSLGRFQLLNRLGAGGMGVVYSAYDPELDRTVAVKLVRVSPSSGRAAMEEGRALARLSHPNVVPVFEVGYAGDHVYIVMELVLGQTLRRWASGRRLGEVVKAYRQAGAGLAAAHAVGLVHQDFKPDNAIMGADGRVRVVDFGLARDAEAAERRRDAPPPERRRAGTPQYMAPEQKAGGPITAATDQFGLCASLREALPSPPPRWLKVIVDRGCAADAKDRFPSMSVLVDALGRDPLAVRRRWLGASVLAVLAAVLFVIGRTTVASRAISCAAGSARIATAWAPTGRGTVLHSLVQLGTYGASVRQALQVQTGDYETRWADGYRRACEAHQAGVESEGLRDRRMACLETGRRALTALASMVGTIEEANLGNLVLAARALPDPGACAQGAAMLADVTPPSTANAARVSELRSQLAGARVRLAGGRLREVRSESEGLVRQARTLAYPPLLAEALLVLGHATMSMDERTAAIAPLTEAYTLAFRTGDDALAVEAWARRAWVRGTTAGGEDSLTGGDIVQAVAEHLPAPSFARALLYNNLGSIQLELEHREQSAPVFERAAREARDVVGPGAIELLNIPINQALATDEAARRESLLARAVAVRTGLLGPDHPLTLEARWLQGDHTEGLAAALKVLVPTCAALRPHNAVLAKHCWREVAFIQGDLGRRAEAIATLTVARSIDVAPESDIPGILPYLWLWEGDAETAASAFAALVRDLPASDSQPWWDRKERAELQVGWAQALLASGQVREARRTLESAVRGLTDIAHKFPYPPVERRLGRARAELARTLALLRAPAREIQPQADAALRWVRRTGGGDGAIHELERLGSGASH
jgi:eukaryotic-like serine/threonine-protein kinase